MRRLLKAAVLAALLATPTLARAQAQAQAVEPAEVQSAIIGYRWKILRYFDGAALVAPNLWSSVTRSELPPVGITLRQDGSLSGSAGCGMMIGRYTLEGTHVTLQIGVLIGGVCADGHYQQQERIIAALERARRLERNGDRVDLLDADGVVMAELERWPETGE